MPKPIPIPKISTKEKIVVISCAYTHPLCKLRTKNKKKIHKSKKTHGKKKKLIFLPKVSIIFSHANHTFFILEP